MISAAGVFPQDHIFFSGRHYDPVLDGHGLSGGESFIDRINGAIMDDLVNRGFIPTGMKSQQENDRDEAESTVHGIRGNVIDKSKI